MTEKSAVRVLVSSDLHFEFVSDFRFRYSDLVFQQHHFVNEDAGGDAQIERIGLAGHGNRGPLAQ